MTAIDSVRETQKLYHNRIDRIKTVWNSLSDEQQVWARLTIADPLTRRLHYHVEPASVTGCLDRLRTGHWDDWNQEAEEVLNFLIALTNERK